MRLKARRGLTMPDPLVSLIDVVFFLLVFFMLVGRMDATAPFDVSPPISVLGEDLPTGGLTVSIGAEGQMALDGVELDAAALVARLAALRESRPDLLVRVNAHGALRLSILLPLVADIEAAGVGDIVLVVTPNPI
ncbi:biopolymer transporter ExbD [Abyssibius alkaniclasticus]|uniref:ExbD/TolR family protein n=1 Tax=Abyssibius alkaniclasticus TaxID=2881234 RepID=UPI002363E017|nr:biopolymer transporter ExbD [Abyssibius alkaniclasticus]UPH71679.1 biopolymer transporter ExbD [Abyssibius alkaniclasticus]|tara:strand:- start:236 stop:640 length:405 start_codon:yes stop_codon:yes gene_type:complete